MIKSIFLPPENLIMMQFVILAIFVVISTAEADISNDRNVGEKDASFSVFVSNIEQTGSDGAASQSLCEFFPNSDVDKSMMMVLPMTETVEPIGGEDYYDYDADMTPCMEYCASNPDCGGFTTFTYTSRPSCTFYSGEILDSLIRPEPGLNLYKC